MAVFLSLMGALLVTTFISVEFNRVEYDSTELDNTIETITLENRQEEYVPEFIEKQIVPKYKLVYIDSEYVTHPIMTMKTKAECERVKEKLKNDPNVMKEGVVNILCFKYYAP